LAAERLPLSAVYTIPMRLSRVCSLLLIAALAAPAAESLDWKKIDEETLRIYQSLVRIDSTDPPGNETRVVDYVKTVLDAEGIPYSVLAKDPARANITARLKGNGSRRPLLIIGHSDTVKVDEKKWTYPPFSATRKDGYIYGRGTLDDKDNLTASLMTLILLKRQGVKLDRDVIFLSEAGEEAATDPGIGFLVNERWSDVEAEYCLAEGGSVVRRKGEVRYALIQTAEKIPQLVRLTAHGPAGHGSRPLRTNSVVHLARAVETIAMWDPPMRFNDTTRYYFEKLASVSPPEAAAHYNGLFDSAKSAAARDYLANNEPGNYSMLHTSISPNIIRAGYQINVIPSSAEAELDVRALPDEDMPNFVDLIRKQISDPAIDVTLEHRNERPHSDPSSIRSEAFAVIEAANRRVYNISTIPVMSTGATDMAFLRSKGVQCYGIGPMVDEEDAPKGFGAHSDQERLLEEGLYKFVRFNWDVVTKLAEGK
jgi:acetylornithine deacetylase/succinyl-diaminopimelate desuccinylase-like protein